jgi:hypothetical protein
MNIENILINEKKSISLALKILNTMRDVIRLILSVEDDNKTVSCSLLMATLEDDLQ